ncbi:MAG: sensor histidine kinase [Bacteroidota bacterium]
MKSNLSVEDKLRERIKELSCLYEISSIIRTYEGDKKETLSKIACILKDAWQFPADVCIKFDIQKINIVVGKKPTTSVFLKKDVYVWKEKEGAISVHYPKNLYSKDDFLKEENDLLHKVAIEISDFLEKEKHKAQEKILKRSAERNDRLSILGEITAGIAHELNTPLGNILGFAELISEQTEHWKNLPNAQQDLVKSIHQDTDKIIKAAVFSREVVKKLMFFACEMPHQQEEIEIKPVVEQAVSLLRQNFKKAEIECRLSCSNSAITAKINSVQLTQVIFNLLINAIYASPKNSIIHIELEEESETKSTLIRVKDEGSGISPEHKTKIFEPFFSTKPVGEGTGLGLSVVHGIIKAHKGEILYANNHPKGSIFTIQLPII